MISKLQKNPGKMEIHPVECLAGSVNFPLVFYRRVFRIVMIKLICRMLECNMDLL